MKNDPLCIKEDVCDMAVCDGVSSCSHAVLKTAVLAQQTNNTGSPKLPPFGEFEAWCRNNCIHVSVCKPIYEWFGRQLRAGA